MTSSDIYVKFRVGDEAYALPIESTVEVSDLGEVSSVPGTSATVMGVLNLHGQVMPVVDLAAVLGLSRRERAQRVVVAERDGLLVGLAVDDVTDVSPIPAEGEEAESEYLSFAVLEEKRLIGIVDLERVIEALSQDAM